MRIRSRLFRLAAAAVLWAAAMTALAPPSSATTDDSELFMMSVSPFHPAVSS
jgi:hypothetical protein